VDVILKLLTLMIIGITCVTVKIVLLKFQNLVGIGRNFIVKIVRKQIITIVSGVVLLREWMNLILVFSISHQKKLRQLIHKNVCFYNMRGWQLKMLVIPEIVCKCLLNMIRQDKSVFMLVLCTVNIIFRAA